MAWGHGGLFSPEPEPGTGKRLVPSTVLDRAETTFLNGVLLTVIHRLEHQLERDYRHWATAQFSTKLPTNSSCY